QHFLGRIYDELVIGIIELQLGPRNGDAIFTNSQEATDISNGVKDGALLSVNDQLVDFAQIIIFQVHQIVIIGLRQLQDVTTFSRGFNAQAQVFQAQQRADIVQQITFDRGLLGQVSLNTRVNQNKVVV